MVKPKEFLKPKGKVKITKIFVNSKNGQMSVVLPRKKMKIVPTKLEISYW